ncbi:hypothetical protein GOODEAATRI_032703, partial [Goodea atripinnis]
ANGPGRRSLPVRAAEPGPSQNKVSRSQDRHIKKPDLQPQQKKFSCLRIKFCSGGCRVLCS